MDTANVMVRLDRVAKDETTDICAKWIPQNFSPMLRCWVQIFGFPFQMVALT